IDNLNDANGQMMMIFATLNEGIKVAEKNNQVIREGLLKTDGEEENMITKMRREQKRTEVESHIALLDQSAADTVMTLSDLTSQSSRAKTMKDAVTTQEHQARNMHSQGVAGVA